MKKGPRGVPCVGEVATSSVHDRVGGQHLPAILADLDQIGDLEGHTQADFAQLGAIVPHEVEDLGVFTVLKAVASEQTFNIVLLSIPMNLTDAQHLVTLGVDRQIKVVATRLESFQVVLQLLGLDGAKVQVGDEHHRTIELKVVRDAFAAQQGTVGVPEDAAALATVQRSLENVQCQIVHQNGVTVVKHQHVLGVGELVQLSVQTKSGHSTLDNLKANLAASQLVEQAGLLQLSLNTVGLANTRRARHDHGANVAVDRSLGHLVQNGEAGGNAIHCLLIRLHRLTLNRCSSGNSSVGGRESHHTSRCSTHVADRGSTVQVLKVGRGRDPDTATITTVGEGCMTVVLDGNEATAGAFLVFLDHGKHTGNRLVVVGTLENADLSHSLISLITD